MIPETFVAGCEGVAFHNGVVVLDLAGLSASERTPDGAPKRELRHRLFLTPAALVELVHASQSMLEKLVENKVLIPGQAAPGQPAQAGAPKPDKKKQGGPPSSPNF